MCGIADLQQKNYTNAGQKEDIEWWSHVEPYIDEHKRPWNQPKSDDKDTTIIYNGLVKKCGIFRWQNPQYVARSSVKL